MVAASPMDTASVISSELAGGYTCILFVMRYLARLVLPETHALTRNIHDDLMHVKNVDGFSNFSVPRNIRLSHDYFQRLLAGFCVRFCIFLQSTMVSSEFLFLTKTQIRSTPSVFQCFSLFLCFHRQLYYFVRGALSYRELYNFIACLPRLVLMEPTTRVLNS